MPKIDEATLSYLTRLCRIECTEEERKGLLKDLFQILTYFEELQKVDTEGVSPCHHVLSEMESTYRKDIPGEVIPRQVLLDNAPAHTGGFIRIPPVFKKGNQ